MSELINNRERRIANLKEIIRHLHQGLPEEEVRARLAEIVEQTDAGEIAAMEEQLVAEGMSVDEVRSMCDLHSRLTRELLREPPHAAPLPAGHPVQSFQAENRALAAEIAATRRELAAVQASAAAGGPDDGLAALDALQAKLNALMDVDKHYRRKEHLLFPCLERHSVTAPSKVMWAKDDEVRGLLKTARAALAFAQSGRGPGLAVVAPAVEAALAAVEEMIAKEEMILLPLARDLLTEQEWGEIWQESPQFGWCLVEPGRAYRAPGARGPAETVAVPQGKAMIFPSGSLTFEQLLGLFSTLPVDLTFVDADDRVAFFSQGRDRIFERAATVIGRKVQFCHPPRSVHVVDRILEDFRAGRQDVAEFWIDLRGRFVHIRYFAVRDDGGSYLGTLEVTQDLTRLRELRGERRLLEYEAAAAAPAWFDPARVAVRVDAGPLLAAGEHPAARVRQAAAGLPAGGLLALETTFVPEPLIGLLRQDGFEIWTTEESPGRFVTYFTRP
jgi:DUF438 domain-containing protein